MLDDAMKVLLRKLIVGHEDCKKFPYTDSVGKITIGIGYNLSDRGLSDDWINTQFEEDVNFFYNQLNNTFSWYKNLNDARKIALVDMSFMGFKKFLEFKKMISCLEKNDFKKAADEMLNSVWAAQVKKRAVDLANIILTGEL